MRDNLLVAEEEDERTFAGETNRNTNEKQEREKDGDKELMRRSMSQAFGLALAESHGRLFQAFFSFSFFW